LRLEVKFSTDFAAVEADWLIPSKPDFRACEFWLAVCAALPIVATDLPTDSAALAAREAAV
jgi:hypothetical protein